MIGELFISQKCDFWAECACCSARNHKLFCEERILHCCRYCQFNMFVGQSALHVQQIRRSDRTICRQFQACALNKGSGSHDDIILVTGHIGRNRFDRCVHGGIFLDCLSKSDHSFLARQCDHLDQISARAVPCRSG